jgi:uncharacterized protein YdeI (YjbR/CyaY-like superfamily)
MEENGTSEKVDRLLMGMPRWRKEIVALRRLILDCGLVEDLKWGWPCYALDGSNVVLIHGFKTYCAVLFFKGALMQDPEGILVRQTENVQAARQIRFENLDEIRLKKTALKAYVLQAMEVKRAGGKIAFRKTSDFPMPEEFSARLEGIPELKAAFEALTPGRQRAYLLHFSSARQSATRQARIDKCMPKILEGKGLTD